MSIALLRRAAVWFGILWAMPAWATTLAVLPLEPGGKSESYEGLGKALAGMLVADLSQADGLVLVERERLDAVLSELALADTGFLDPATAAKVGKGVGAEVVLVGTWTVAEGTFLLDARLVKVDRGTILKAAAADGTVGDFVSVEKDLVSELLEGLDIALSSSAQRRIWGAAPTEEFEAFVAYSQGIAASDRGAWDEARAAYERALAADPDFVDARSAVDGIAKAVEAARAQAAAAASGAATAAVTKILAEVPDERTRPAGFVHDAASEAAFAIRAMALENAGRPCDRADEMLAFGERIGWAEEPIDRTAQRTGVSFAEARGFGPIPNDVPGPESLHDSLWERMKVYDDLDGYLFGHEWFGRIDEGSGLVASIVACYPPRERLDAIDAVRKSVDRAGRGGLRDGEASLSLDETLVILWAHQRATWLGADDETERRLKALLDAHPDDAVRPTLSQAIDEILRVAQAWEDHRRRTHGRPEAELIAFEEAMSKGDTALIVAEGPWCPTIAMVMRTAASSWVARVPEVRDDPMLWWMHLDMAGSDWAVASSLGCVKGIPARYADADALASTTRAGIGAMPPEKAKSNDCAFTVSMLEGMLQPAAVERAKTSPPGGEAAWAYGVAINWYGALVFQGCVDDRMGK